MPNMENILPYANLTHEAAIHGGPDAFKAELMQTGEIRGGAYLLVTEGAVLALAKGAQWAYKKLKESNREWAKAVVGKIDGAKEWIKETTQRIINPNDDTSEADQNEEDFVIE